MVLKRGVVSRLTRESQLADHLETLVSKKTIYFPNLNGVRFIASFSVLIHHLEQVKEVFSLHNIYDNHLIKDMGKLGVGLFFVLSGFLITFLLLVEKNRKGKIELGNFYVRRVLRIWPLYLLVVLLAFFVFPHLSLFYDGRPAGYIYDADFYKRLALFLCMLPNFGFILYQSPYLCAQTWSVGVEEQFYVLWPLVIGSATLIRALRPVVIYGLAIFCFSYVWITLDRANLSPEVVSNFTGHYLSQFRILTMIIGGLGSWLIFSKQVRVLAFLFRRDVQVIVYTTLVYCLGTGFYMSGVNLEFYALFFCFFIMNVAANPDSIINLEFPAISFLGKISYGTYMYHTAVIVLVINCINRFLAPGLSAVAFNSILYPLAIGLSVLVSALSYTYFEKPFLRVKERFGQFSKNSSPRSD
ncbi:hypothetical protein GCM10023187_28490 [Nibrella viscosa]|uniref:Acyltransferase 3 domain-containing protein n=1 Tax=Nibrella viscosa TaxID=1084524 RepID=A0ABP8KJJ7_9BACT